MPAPETATAGAATQTFGDSAAAAMPIAINKSPNPYTLAAPRRSTHVPADRLPSTTPRPALPISKPNPKSPASNDTFASLTSATLTPALASMPTFQARRTVKQRARAADQREALTKVAPVARSGRARRLEQ